MPQSTFKIGDKTFQSRLFLGTGKFGSNIQMQEAIIASGSELVTVALKRIDLETETDAILSHLNILPFYPTLREREMLKKLFLRHNWLEKLYKPIGSN
jgi:thiazole synthase ThiGH ThiG subunit